MAKVTTSPGFGLSEIGFRYGRRSALRDINLSFGHGVYGLVGPNGAGKTTLLKLLATVQKPTAGTIHLLGQNPRDGKQLRDIRRLLGYLPQSFGFYSNFTVFEFVEYFALLKEMPPSLIRSSVAEAICRVGLEDQASTRMKALSGGMIRRVGIAQAIVNRPHLLILDEPTTGLDPEQRVRFRAQIRELGNHSTIVLSTHLVEDVAAVCDELSVLADGAIQYTGTPSNMEQLGAGHPSLDGESPIERGYRAVLNGSEK